MATTNKSTKAKTKKPVKKTPAKTTKKSKSAKSASTSSKTTTKVLAKKASKLTSSRNPISILLTRLNIFSAVVSAGLAVMAYMLMNTTTYELVTGLVAKNNLANSDNIYVPAIYHIYDLQIRFALMAVLIISFVVSVLLLSVYRDKYASEIKSKVHPLRWIELGIVSALSISVVALINGIQDIPTLKVIAGLVVVTSILGWISEKRAVQASRLVRSEYWISVLTGVLPWIIIIGYIAGTYVFGNITNSWFVYVATAGVLLGFVAYCKNLHNYLKANGSTVNYEVVERNYIVIGIVSRLVLALSLIVGFQK